MEQIRTSVIVKVYVNSLFVTQTRGRLVESLCLDNKRINPAVRLHLWSAGAIDPIPARYYCESMPKFSPGASINQVTTDKMQRCLPRTIGKVIAWTCAMMPSKLRATSSPAFLAAIESPILVADAIIQLTGFAAGLSDATLFLPLAILVHVKT